MASLAVTIITVALNSVVIRVSADYELILSQKDIRIARFSSNVRTTYLENEDDPTANTFTNIGNLNPSDFVDDEGYYQFKLVYTNVHDYFADKSVNNELNQILEWKQTSWLTNTTITGYTPINIPTQTNFNYINSDFEGLGLSSYTGCFMDGDAHSASNWWHCAGTISSSANGGIPAFNEQLAFTAALYVYKATNQPTASPTLSTFCGTFSGATTEAGDINYYNFTLESLTDLILDVCDASYDTWLYFLTADGEIIDHCDDCGDCGLQTVLEIDLVPPGDYLIGIGGFASNYGSYKIEAICKRPIPRCATFSGATTEAYDINWYNFSVSETTDIVIDVCDADYDTYLYLNTADGQPIDECDDCGDCGFQTVLEVSELPAGDYLIGIGGFWTDYGSYTIEVFCHGAGEPICNDYLYIDDHGAATYEEAEARCDAIGGGLATITSEEDCQCIKQALDGKEAAWMGLNSLSHEGNLFFEYDDGSLCPAQFIGSGACLSGNCWVNGKPLNCDDEERGSQCVGISSDGLNNDISCGRIRNGILCNSAFYSDSAKQIGLNEMVEHQVDDVISSFSKRGSEAIPLSSEIVFWGSIVFILMVNLLCCYLCLCHHAKYQKVFDDNVN